MSVAVFHHIGEPDRTTFTNSLEQILDYGGLVTFDGVYTDVFEHRMELAPKNPILFISGDQIGREGFCNREQLEEMRCLGFELGWHGWNHTRLTELDEQQIMAQLRKPDWVKPLYAYPHGDFDERCPKILEVMYYREAFSTTQGNAYRFTRHREYI